MMYCLFNSLQAIPIIGKVIDQQSKLPIENAVIGITDKEHSNWGHYSVTADFYCLTDSSGKFTIDTIEDDASYTIVADATGFYSQKIPRVPAGQKNLIIELNKATETKPASIPAKSTCEVIFHFKTSYNSALPKGRIEVSTFTDKNEKFHHYNNNRSIDIIDRSARVQVNPPCYIHVEPVSLIGGWFREFSSDEIINSASTTYETTIDIQPAGSIYGRTLDSQGKITQGAKLQLHPLTNSISSYRDPIKESSFCFSPLPLGSAFIVFAMYGNFLMASPEIRLTPQSPTQEIIFQYKKGINKKGKIMNENNKPVEDLICTLYYHYNNQINLDLANPVEINAYGEFILDNLDLEAKEKYFLSIRSKKDYVPQSCIISPNQDDLVIHLKEGKSLKGLILDKDTKKPMSNITVSAHPTNKDDQFTSNYLFYQAERDTDNTGQFQFSTLEKQKYKLSIYSNDPNFRIDTQNVIVTGGQTEPVTIYAKLLKRVQ